MALLIYSAITSLDGYVADEDGHFDWAEPDEEVHAFVNDLERPVGTFLLGRRMYDVLLASETIDWPTNRPSSGTSRRSGTVSTRSSTPLRWTRHPISPPRRSRRSWSTRSTCSSRLSSWAAATGRCPTAST